MGWRRGKCSSDFLNFRIYRDFRTATKRVGQEFPKRVYWWISYAHEPTKLSEPAKLTTWRQENAYKPLQIPPPPSKNLIGAALAGPEIDCSLVLAPAPIVASSVIDLRDPEIGRVPLPVCSLPIRILISPQQQQQQRRRRDGGGATSTTIKSSKQEAIIRTFRIFDDGLGDVQTPLIHIKETVSFDLDKVTGIFYYISNYLFSVGLRIFSLMMGP
jgi:protein N-lysine methyltransferase METTL21D